MYLIVCLLLMIQEKVKMSNEHLTFVAHMATK